MNKMNRIRHDQITRLFRALQYPLVRVTVAYPHEVPGVPINLCKRPSGEEIFWDLDQLLANLPRLSRHNVSGKNVFITPIEQEGKYIYLLLDDIRGEFFTQGFQPNSILQTSPLSQQAVWVLPYVRERRVYIDVFNHLNEVYGDPKITGLRHPFRLPGFTNRKSKYEVDGRFPLVKLRKSSSRLCQQMVEFVAGFERPQTPPPPIAAETDGQNTQITAWGRRAPLCGGNPPAGLIASSDALKAWGAHKTDILAHTPDLPISFVDFRISERLIRTGHSQADVERAILQNTDRSRADNADYARRTAERAAATAFLPRPGETPAQQSKRSAFYRRLEATSLVTNKAVWGHLPPPLRRRNPSSGPVNVDGCQ